MTVNSMLVDLPQGVDRARTAALYEKFQEVVNGWPDKALHPTEVVTATALVIASLVISPSIGDQSDEAVAGRLADVVTVIYLFANQARTPVTPS